MFNPKAVAVVRNRPPTFMLSITTLGVHLLRSSPVVLALQSSLPHMRVDPEIDLLLSPLLGVPTTALTRPKGDHGLVPLPVNLNPGASSNRPISCKIWLRGLVFLVFI